MEARTGRQSRPECVGRGVQSERSRAMRLALLSAALLAFGLPSLTLADAGSESIGVSPIEVHVANLSPGDATEFELVIRNQEDSARILVLTIFQPPAEARRSGWAELPDTDWISFSSEDIQVDAGSEATVKVKVAIPDEGRWEGKDWEIWLGVSPRSAEMVVAEVYVRLMISTRAAVNALSSMRIAGGIATAVILLGYAAYHWRRRRAKVA